jgi:thiol-disulfide isomerase/thioredoxin
MKKNLILWGTAVVLVLTALYVTKYYNRDNKVTALQSASTQVTSSSIDILTGKKAIDFSLTDLDGNKVSLKDLKGKNVYINFWATWCPWCIKELPDIEKIYQEYKDKDLVVLAVDIGEDKTTVKNFITKNSYYLNVQLETDQSVSQAYGISSIPVSMFIDKDGNIAAKRVGALSEEEMQSYVKQLSGR